MAPAALELAPEVSLRPEPFGALAYHFDNRRLSFLRSPELVALVRSLGHHPDTDAALAASGIDPARWPTFRTALDSLLASEVLRERSERAPRVDGGCPPPVVPAASGGPSVAPLQRGLDAPICLTWELTYGCNLACVHCLSSSGRRDPDELSTDQLFALVDELRRLQVFYVNIGGGEPTTRPDFYDVVDRCVDSGVGVKFSTNGSTITPARAARLAATDHVDVQISVDGADAATNDAVRGEGSFAVACRAMGALADAGFGAFKISVVVTRHNVPQLGALAGLADRYGAQLRLTRFRPSGRGAATWEALHPTSEQQRVLHAWLLERPDVLTGDSFFHLSALGQPLPGLNLCGAGRVVCLIDPVGDVYACPFVLHDDFRAGSVLDPGGFTEVWRGSPLFLSLRQPTSAGACASCGAYDACQGGCMAAKFFTGLPLDGPDPECVLGHGEQALAGAGAQRLPAPGPTHSVPVRLGRR